MRASRIAFAAFGWLGAVILLLNGLVLSLWAILTTQSAFLLGAFLMLALAFVVAGLTNLFQRRYRRHPPANPQQLWVLTAAFAGVVVVTIIITALVSSSITG